MMEDMRIENHSSWIDLVFKISSTYFRINIWMHTADVLGQELLTIIHSKVFSVKIFLCVIEKIC